MTADGKLTTGAGKAHDSGRVAFCVRFCLCFLFFSGFCCCCCFGHGLTKTPCVMSTRCYGLIMQACAKSPGSQTPGDSGTPWSPRALTVVSARKLEKLALNSGTTGGARKMTQNASKNAQLPSFHHQTLSMTESEAPPLTSTISSMICGTRRHDLLLHDLWHEMPRSAHHRTS